MEPSAEGRGAGSSGMIFPEEPPPFPPPTPGLPTTPSPEADWVLVYAGRQRRTMDASLCLASQEIEHFLDEEGRQTGIWVPLANEERARDQLTLYFAENRRRLWLDEIREEVRFTPAALLVLVPASVVFVLQTRWNLNASLLVPSGRCSSEAVLAGEWWRVFTALTLHADLEHYLSNLTGGFLLFTLVLSKVNAGLGVFSIFLLAGLANLLTILTVPLFSHQPHANIGFSTAVFACLGYVAAAEAWRRLVLAPADRRSWAPVSAAFMIAVWIGTGADVDVAAHFFGFLCGVMGGLGAAALERRTRAAWVQVFLLAAAYGWIWWCWELAM